MELRSPSAPKTRGCGVLPAALAVQSVRHPSAGDVPPRDLGEHKTEPGEIPGMQPPMLGAMQPF